MKYYKVNLAHTRRSRGRPVWIHMRAEDQAEALAIAKARCKYANDIYAPTVEIVEITEDEYDQAIKRLLT